MIIEIIDGVIRAKLPDDGGLEIERGREQLWVWWNGQYVEDLSVLPRWVFQTVNYLAETCLEAARRIEEHYEEAHDDPA